MKKYKYKTIQLKSAEVEEHLNIEGEDGWRVLDISWSDTGAWASVLLEKEL